MGEKEAPRTCHGHGYSPMCCRGKDDVSILSPIPTAFSNHQQGGINNCKPFEQVKKNYYTHQGKIEETQVDMIMDAVT